MDTTNPNPTTAAGTTEVRRTISPYDLTSADNPAAAPTLEGNKEMRCFPQSKVEVMGIPSPLLKLKSWQWWVLVFINIFFLIGGQAASVLLGRFYYYEGGNSKWMATLVQTAAFPILYIPLLAPLKPLSSSIFCSVSLSLETTCCLCWTSLPLCIHLFPHLRHPVQVHFRVSVYPRCISSLLSLLLSLMQFSFEKILKKETFSVVLEMQINTCLVATCVAFIGIFASGEWRWKDQNVYKTRETFS
ncbi:unnamed protein product [Eruca vesicaria subsp. sativa]|uniref:Uncharacterized protein n=1 Tax=Eruca vesicaria subsp. sativa TaxID=29727 RepID=A0ABC8M3R1_ERUVS|nr:unnamed protein product [Eruca vesicaria subsp. sativa]